MSEEIWSEFNYTIYCQLFDLFFKIIITKIDYFICCGSSDLQLAIALQQQEFDQQPQRQNSQQPSVSNSRLVTGPQVKFHILSSKWYT